MSKFEKLMSLSPTQHCMSSEESSKLWIPHHAACETRRAQLSPTLCRGLGWSSGGKAGSSAPRVMHDDSAICVIHSVRGPGIAILVCMSIATIRVMHAQAHDHCSAHNGPFEVWEPGQGHVMHVCRHVPAAHASHQPRLHWGCAQTPSS